MKIIITLFSSLSLIASPVSVLSCSEKNYNFSLTEPLGDIIDTFDKRNVEDFFFGYYDYEWHRTTEVFIKFKDKTEVTEYGELHGDLVYWIKHISLGINRLPNQEKYYGYNKWVKEIPEWAWRQSGLWNPWGNKPELPKN